MSVRRYGFRILVHKRQIVARVRKSVISWNLKKAQEKESKSDVI